MKARVVGGDCRTTTAVLTLFGKMVPVCFEGPGHGEKALAWVQGWEDHWDKCLEMIKDIESEVMDGFIDALLDNGVDFATIEIALESCKIGKDDE